MRLVVLATLAISTVAVADPPPGIYSLARSEPARMTVNGKRLPLCPEDAYPIPQELTIDYDLSPIVIVNDEEWQKGELTTDENGRQNDDPLRTAHNPKPPPRASVNVWFKTERDHAVGVFYFWMSDAKGPAKCVTAFRFVGTYRP